MTEVDKIIALIEKSISHSLSDNDVATLRRVLLVSGQGNVLQIGKYNIHIEQGQNLHIGDHIYQGPDVETLRQVMREVQAEIASDRYAASLQEYFHALRRYCAELPYLTLTDIRPPKNLDEVYVPLRARQRESEPLPRGPAVQEESLTVEQVLRQAQTSHLLILGQPGAGKSTLLRQLAERTYDAPHAIGLDRHHLPLLLPLRALAHAEGALEERLNQALQNELRLTRPLPDGFLDAWPQRLDTPWLFLLDGLDEVPADSSRSFRQWISDLLAHPNITRVILTSRPSAYTEKEWESSRLSVYEIQPFTPDQTAELARRWFGEGAFGFLQALETVRSSVLTETPLLITIAAKVYLERKSLPERRSQLYQEFVDIWLDEARERGLRDELDAALLDLAQPALAHLALAMTDHHDWTDEKSLIPVVAEYLDEQLNLKARAPAVAERFLRVMARRSGVFLKREEQYEWVHPTFREYFAALALNQQLESGKSFEEVLSERAMQEEWEDTIITLAKISNKQDALVIWLSEQTVTRKRGVFALLSFRCGWEALLITKASRVRNYVIKALISALGDYYNNTGEIASEMLVAIGVDAIKPLILALNTPNEYVRRNAYQALTKIGASAVEMLIDSLKGSVRWYAILALGEIGDPRAVEPLIACLRDASPFVRQVAANALGKIKDSRAVEPLVDALSDPDETVRKNAVQALVEIGSFPAIEQFITMLGDPSEEVRMLAVRALVEIGAPAVEMLIDSLKGNVRWYAILALGEIGDPRAVEPLIACLRDTSPFVRQVAANALGKIKDSRAVEPLVDALRDPDGTVRKNAAEALGKSSCLQAVDPLINALRDRNEAVKESAAEALGQLGDTRAVKPLIELLYTSKWWSIRCSVVRALGQIRDPEAVTALVSILDDPDEDVGRSLVYSLSKIGTPAVEPLIMALRSPDTIVRARAVAALGEIGDPRALPALEQLMRRDGECRMAAMEAIIAIEQVKPNNKE
jgi:HEAT repeat protein